VLAFKSATESAKNAPHVSNAGVFSAGRFVSCAIKVAASINTITIIFDMKSSRDLDLSDGIRRHR
jgi:hypothetical protein